MRTVFLLACSLAAVACLAVARAQAPNPNASAAGKACQQKCAAEQQQCQAAVNKGGTTSNYVMCEGNVGQCLQACPP